MNIRRSAVIASLVLAPAFAVAACKSREAPKEVTAAIPEDPLAHAPPAPPDVASPPADAVKSEGGTLSKIIKEGNGKIHPVSNDSVKVTFTGWTTNGVAFAHGEELTFHALRAIPGWADVLPEMVTGETRRLWVPPTQAYPQMPGAPAGMLVFDLELLDITPGPKAPDDIGYGPKAGLSSKVITNGTGKIHPGPNDFVKVTFASWTTDGKPFNRGEDVPIPVSRAIPGWVDALQEMVIGETRRVWVPPALAYPGRPGAPTRTIVFDITLRDIAPGPKPPANVAEAPADASITKRGLASKILTPGSGRLHPRASDSVRVRYASWRRDGRLVDSTGDIPVVRPVSAGFDGWTDGLRLMVPGETRTLWIPSSLGPKIQGASAPPPDVTIVVELLDILAAPKAPPDVKAPPRGAIVEKTGLASKVLTKGTGTVHPSKDSMVTVQFAGWTTDGKLINSTLTRGAPATVPVGGSIPGWAEALQLMVEGEKRRVWIPKKLAYNGAPDAPSGMLVFEIELQKIQPSKPL